MWNAIVLGIHSAWVNHGVDGLCVVILSNGTVTLTRTHDGTGGLHQVPITPSHPHTPCCCVWHRRASASHPPHTHIPLLPQKNDAVTSHTPLTPAVTMLSVAQESFIKAIRYQAGEGDLLGTIDTLTVLANSLFPPTA